MKRVSIIIVSVLLVCGVFFFSQQKRNLAFKSVSKESPRSVTTLHQPPQVGSKTIKQLENKTFNFKRPGRIMGIYSTSWIAGSQRMQNLIQLIKNTSINSIVIDIKDDTGVISYPSSVPLAKEIGATSNRIRNIRELVAELKKANIYVIARIVVFKDPLLAEKHKEIAVKNRNGGIWHDRKGMIWVDPNCRKVWQYNQDIAKEAVSMGFSEIQFDYVRFLSDGKISQAVYPYSQGESKEDVIHNFLQSSRKEMNALGVPLSADIFGLVLSTPDDLNIGQRLEKIADAVDIISPMVYPSHYPRGTFDIAQPDLHPYEVIDHALQDCLKRIPDHKVKIRPWLQDFNLGSHYGSEQLQAQIRALEKNGIHDFLFWNPSNRYDQSKYEQIP